MIFEVLDYTFRILIFWVAWCTKKPGLRERPKVSCARPKRLSICSLASMTPWWSKYGTSTLPKLDTNTNKVWFGTCIYVSTSVYLSFQMWLFWVSIVKFQGQYWTESIEPYPYTSFHHQPHFIVEVILITCLTLRISHIPRPVANWATYPGSVAWELLSSSANIWSISSSLGGLTQKTLGASKIFLYSR